MQLNPFTRKQEKFEDSSLQSAAVIEAATAYLTRQAIDVAEVHVIEVQETLYLVVHVNPQLRSPRLGSIGTQLRLFLTRCLDISLKKVFWCFDDMGESERPTNPLKSESIESKNAARRPGDLDLTVTQTTFYDIRHLAKTAMEVTEITLAEFNRIAIGTPTGCEASVVA